MIRTIICTDVETTGLSPETDRCIEVACVRYDVPSASVTEAFSTLIYSDSNAAEAINRIPVAALACGHQAPDAWRRVEALVSQSAGDTIFMAHRADFDRSFYPADVAKLAPWCCSKFDIEFPLSKPGASLVEVALAHGVPVWANHRAMTDATLIAQVLRRVHELGHDIDAMLACAMLPRVTVQALVSFDEKDKAKAAGFSFDGATKRWTKRVIKGEVANFDFQVREVQA